MNPRVRQRVEEDGEDMNRRVVRRRFDEDVAPEVRGSKDWTSLTYDLMLYVFTLLDSRNRASLASTCATWRSLGASPYLWNSLDLRAHRFNGLDSHAALVILKARKLREISGEGCENVTDATFSMIVIRHKDLESVQLGPGFGESHLLS
ncbi:Protein ARABIDILLO 2 [Raphanus sativus]|nr:Protein ARABIDILLO 2 [Raphanus sativus]